ncbi:MAG: FAD-dependent oxidoreductase [Promethearchaeota archaeon]
MFKAHMDSLKIQFITDEIISISKENDYFLSKSLFQIYKCQTICIATGSEKKKLRGQGEEKFVGRGVSYCATCDGGFFKDKITYMIGGSDSAAKEAFHLSQYCKKVYIIYRGEEIRAEPINKKGVF